MARKLDAFADGFLKQAQWCTDLGSPFSGALMTQAADALRLGTDFVTTYMPWWQGTTTGDVSADVVPLRFLGCAHALALGGQAPALARHYPSCGGDGVADNLWQAVLEAFAAHPAFTADFVTQPPQTNEVGRAGALMAGLLELAQRTRLPVSLFEIGASAGLLQGLDSFYYRFGGASWGDEASPCRIEPQWLFEAVPPVDAPLSIIGRRACDYAPIDVLDPANALKIRAYIWADQSERLARLEAAIAIAQTVRPQVDAASADDWLADVLAGPGTPGQVRCVFHSIMWQYMPQEVRDRAYGAIAAAGEQANADAPVAWLRFEPETNNEPVQLVLALWRGGPPETRLLAGAHPHATQIGWTGWDKGRVLETPELVQRFS
ncbi:DUF2332 domain-containing protein [Pyruvatibacter mobilis]|uniref:DUF2332 domain-containing protein n=1 Tax=Pyruvatibacter mobilis TaxID=1712261 RepID=UPI003BB1E1C8